MRSTTTTAPVLSVTLSPESLAATVETLPPAIAAFAQCDAICLNLGAALVATLRTYTEGGLPFPLGVIFRRDGIGLFVEDSSPARMFGAISVNMENAHEIDTVRFTGKCDGKDELDMVLTLLTEVETRIAESPKEEAHPLITTAPANTVPA